MNSERGSGRNPANSEGRRLKDPARKPLAAWREWLYTVIFEADTRLGLAFDLFLLLAILGSTAIACLETVESVRPRWSETLLKAEWFFTILFTLEYFLRVVCVRRPLRYIFSFYGIIDLLGCLPGLLLMLGGARSSFAVLRLFRLVRVFRLLRLGWFVNEADELGSAIWRSRAKVVVFLTVVFVCVTVAGTVMYELEHANRKQFSSIPAAIYWATVTMTTVGYGDIVPKSVAGKFLSVLLIVTGYSLIIVPTGFVSAELAKQRRVPDSTQVCHGCMREGHEQDALYCRFCGDKL